MTDKQEILKLIRNTVPNKIPLPPIPQSDNQVLSDGNKSTDYIDFKYAINSKYFVIDESIEFSTKFWKIKDSENRYGKIEIDTIEYEILKDLLNFKKEKRVEKLIAKNVFDVAKNVFDENTIILNQQFIDSN